MQIDKQKLLDYIDKRRFDLDRAYKTLSNSGIGVKLKCENFGKLVEISDLFSLINKGEFDANN